MFEICETDDVESPTSENIEWIIEDVNRLGLCGVFRHYHNIERQNDNNYTPEPNYTDIQNYLMRMEQRVNCSYEKTLEVQAMFYESQRRG
ncbi:MAG: hypothetical protein R6U11_00645 [Bacteroidales bacterium]